MKTKVYRSLLSVAGASGLLLTGSAATRYVDVNNASPSAPPYTSWDTAATNIQDAVDAADPGDEILVANGVYATGGRAVYGTMTNRVAIDKAVTVRSVAGPDMTWIVGQGAGGTGTTNGDGAMRCAYVGTNSALSGFTLTNGHTRMSVDSSENSSGGGVWCESSGLITNCTLSGNSALDAGGGAYSGTLNNCTLTGNSAGAYGGGAYSATLNNCVLTSNSAAQFSGGGAYGGTLNNCTLAGNSAGYGGGASTATARNCILYYNSARSGGANYHGGIVSRSCTEPMPPWGGNLTNAPLFVDTNGWRNLRLQSNSPCINAGSDTYVKGDKDLDGRPRKDGPAVDMGAYEYQGQFNAWLQQYGLPTDGSADYAQSDSDGMNNYQEYRCGTDPTNCLSALCLLALVSTASNVTLCWVGVSNVSYFLECKTDLSAQFNPLATNIVGICGTNSFVDPNGVSPNPVFYRLGVGW